MQLKFNVVLYSMKVSNRHCILYFSVAEGGIFSSSESSCRGKTVPRGKCALLFDDENCGGWEYEVPIGYSELPRFALSGPTKNDAESVWVKPGCKFIGKEHQLP